MLLLPAATIAKLWTLVSPTSFDPTASDVPPFGLQTLPDWPVIAIDESLPTQQDASTA
jgi:hypothetical protein